MAKKPSRTQERQQLLDVASKVAVADTYDVVVIGGGAAGLVAAISAAEEGASVLVLEQALTCGQPILATGNGRCNFANVNLDVRRFNDPAFVDAVCGPHWLDDILGFFRASGLAWCLEEDRLYPASRVSASVRNVLLARARRANVTLAPGREVVGIERGPVVTFRELFNPSGAVVSSQARAVVVATGGGTLPSPGNLGLLTAQLAPVLCPLACEDSPLVALDGRRAHVHAYLTKAGSFFPTWHERGEILFRSYGLSGIVTFDLSRRAETGDLVELDLAPDLNKSQLMQRIAPFTSTSFESGCLDGVLDPQIASLLERLAHERWHLPWPERTSPKTDAEALVLLVKALPFKVTGPTETNHAQVTRGGLVTSQFDAQTLSAHEVPWCFACGEALDIDADCGGFNLSWAWKSGMVAGTSAARHALNTRG